MNFEWDHKIFRVKYWHIMLVDAIYSKYSKGVMSYRINRKLLVMACRSIKSLRELLMVKVGRSA